MPVPNNLERLQRIVRSFGRGFPVVSADDRHRHTICDLAGALAQRLNGNTVLWVILALIPFVGFFFRYVLCRIAAGILDRIDALDSRLAAP